VTSPFASGRRPTASNSRLRVDVIAAGIVAAVLTLTAGILASRSLDDARVASAWVEHTYSVIATLDELHDAVTDVETGQRGYLLTQDPRFLPAAGRLTEARAAFERARSLTRDNADQQRRLDSVRAAMESKLTFVESVLRLVDAGRTDSATALVRGGGGRVTMERLQRQLSLATGVERTLLAARATAETTELAAARRTLFLVLVASAVAGTVALFMLRRVATNLGRMGREAQRAEARAIASEEEAWRAEASARDSEAHYRLLFEANPVPAWVYDQQTLRFLAVNPAACRRYGFSADEFARMTLADICPVEGAAALIQWATEARLHARTESERVHRTKDGRLLTVALSSHALRYQGRSARLVLAHDVTELRRAKAALEELAVRDELTGLLNRRGFRDLAAQELKVARRSGRADAVLYLDLDGFKQVNDVHGHAEGDVALRTLADVLRTTLREGDIIARLGGDEFAVYAPGLARRGEGAVVAARIAAAVRDHSAAAQARGRPYRLATSVGVAEVEPGDDLDALLGRADAALYAQKAARKRAA
jgi:diguanylate cyclase (GGDEF)-like protein/PAS domain S-box-containing protein